MAEKDRWLLLGKLKSAVQKIRFLLNFNVNKWKIASIIGRAPSSKRRLSFNDDDRPGLKAYVEDPDPNPDPNDDPSGSSRGRQLQRTTSYPSEDDIDKRADAFIANFYKQLQYERQISLELRYYRGNSFNSSESP